jgi:beta-aspartyl-peptidase (threonine type)
MFVGLSLGIPQLAPAQEEDKDLKAIRAVLDAQVAAWNKGDLDGFMNGYWENELLSFYSDSTKTHGWKAVLKRYQKKYQGQGKEMGKITFYEVFIRMLGTDDALVTGGFHIQLKTDEKKGPFTLIFRRTPAGWRIIHAHTSL